MIIQKDSFKIRLASPENYFANLKNTFYVLAPVCMSEWTEQKDNFDHFQLINRNYFLIFFFTWTRSGNALIIIKKYYWPLWMIAYICLKIKNMEKMYVKVCSICFYFRAWPLYLEAFIFLDFIFISLHGSLALLRECFHLHVQSFD